MTNGSRHNIGALPRAQVRPEPILGLDSLWAPDKDWHARITRPGCKDWHARGIGLPLHGEPLPDKLLLKADFSMGRPKMHEEPRTPYIDVYALDTNGEATGVPVGAFYNLDLLYSFPDTSVPPFQWLFRRLAPQFAGCRVFRQNHSSPNYSRYYTGGGLHKRDYGKFRINENTGLSVGYADAEGRTWLEARRLGPCTQGYSFIVSRCDRPDVSFHIYEDPSDWADPSNPYELILYVSWVRNKKYTYFGYFILLLWARSPLYRRLRYRE